LVAGNLVTTNNKRLITVEEMRDRLKPTEPCFELAEVNLTTTTAGAGIRRVQVLRVVRDDQPVTFHRDMGPAKDFKTEEFAIPGAVSLGNGRYDVLETVERLVSFADDFRSRQDSPLILQQEMPDLVRAFEQMEERRMDNRVGRKRFAL